MSNMQQRLLVVPQQPEWDALAGDAGRGNHRAVAAALSIRITLSGEFGGGKAISSRVGLYEWWDFENDIALSAELQRQFKQDIPLKKRAEWRGFLADQKTEHERLTGNIVARETRLNAIVYEALDLTPDEIALIEQATKYPYGAV